MTSKRFLASIVFAASLIGIWLSLTQHGTTTPLIAPRQAEPSAVPSLAGTASCSARGCHGDILPRTGQRIERDENTIWLTQDRHAQAYAVLQTTQSEEMTRKLGEKLPAQENPRCLACHVTTGTLAASPAVAGAERDFGVGCESCHGPASKWLDNHTSKTWHDKQVAEKRAYGMTPPGEWRDFARRCTGCHVGAPADGTTAPLRDVNHDLIAAGHPRLTFELSVYLANMPRHWSQLVTASQPNDAGLWALGQLASAEAGLALLADRAAGADKGRPWPELSEYDCFACHHDLTQPDWRQSAHADRPGSLRWGDWQFTMVQLLAAKEPALERALAPGLTSVREQMHQPYSEAAKISGVAGETARALTRFLAEVRLDFDTKRVRQLSGSVLEEGTRLRSWDSVEQCYLALAAFNQVQRDQAAAKVLDDMAQLLAFPAELAVFNSPKRFNPTEFAKRVRLLQTLPRQ